MAGGAVAGVREREVGGRVAAGQEEPVRADDRVAGPEREREADRVEHEARDREVHHEHRLLPSRLRALRSEPRRVRCSARRE